MRKNKLKWAITIGGVVAGGFALLLGIEGVITGTVVGTPGRAEVGPIEVERSENPREFWLSVGLWIFFGVFVVVSCYRGVNESSGKMSKSVEQAVRDEEKKLKKSADEVEKKRDR